MTNNASCLDECCPTLATVGGKCRRARQDASKLRLWSSETEQSRVMPPPELCSLGRLRKGVVTEYGYTVCEGIDMDTRKVVTAHLLL